ncbi:hypothetical protein ALC57_12073 [Trachymyrmex cornetzi]|uniref:Uncharacterized protein n=1 Tax=Trachymyrmex cornetzi TaxID=471704 RepID=A0A151J1J3_9HYME|nr:hypothetical protein ALC57_12565 [Trachymyrmex cornetzi]KYN15700.1 hypothetical protein ALC57_12073 [Trachymyrmex cornetzi]
MPNHPLLSFHVRLFGILILPPTSQKLWVVLPILHLNNIFHKSLAKLSQIVHFIMYLKNQYF